MQRRNVLALAAGAAIAFPLLPTSAASADTSGATGWTVPRCHTVTSDGSLTYTKNNGASLRPTSGDMSPVRYEFSIAALATPDHLISGDEHGRLFHSTDAGCTWTTGATLPSGMDIPQLVAAPDGTAYGWSINSSQLVLIDGETVTPLPDVATGGASLVDLEVDRADAQHLRAVADDGQLVESTNGGSSFQRIGAQPPGVYLYDASIDPNDLDHVVLGTLGASVLTTFDGGATWASVGLGAEGDRVNAFTVEVSPANGKRVYVQGLNITEMDHGAPSQGRHIYASRTGGLGFEVIVDQEPGITLTNGTFLQPHPTRAKTLYFVFGMNFGGYGTDLFRYRDRPHGGKLTVEHNAYDDIKAIAFNPTRPRVMYLGLADEP